MKVGLWRHRDSVTLGSGAVRKDMEDFFVRRLFLKQKKTNFLKLS
jgi:hypothetical protein